MLYDCTSICTLDCLPVCLLLRIAFCAPFNSIRYKRHTCRHIQACGVLRSLQHQQLQRAALSALHTSALTARHYRRQLLLRALWGWRDSVCAGALVASAAVGALRVLRQRHVVAAWWQWVQDQVGAEGLVGCSPDMLECAHVCVQQTTSSCPA